MRVQPLWGDPGDGADLGYLLNLQGNLNVAPTLAGQIGYTINLAGGMVVSTTLSATTDFYAPTSFVIVECGIF